MPNGPGGTLANPKPTTATVYNLQPAFNGLQNNVLDNQPYLDTVYKGVEFTANKRLSNHWQMVAGFTIGKNTGGLNINTTGASGQSATQRPQRSELHDVRQRHRRQRLGPARSGCRAATGCRTSLILAATLVSNRGYPFISTYSVTRAAATAAGVALTRASQTVFLSDRGDERLKAVNLVDLRISRAFRFAAIAGSSRSSTSST